MNDEQTKAELDDGAVVTDSEARTVDEPADDDRAYEAVQPVEDPERRSGDDQPEDTRPSTEAQPEPVTEGSLLPAEQNERLTSRWEEIQASFVDRPQEAVEQADALVADLMNRVTGSLTSERERLEGQWASGEDVSTEDLRVALTRYRTFFDRLLSA